MCEYSKSMCEEVKYSYINLVLFENQIAKHFVDNYIHILHTTGSQICKNNKSVLFIEKRPLEL